MSTSDEEVNFNATYSKSESSTEKPAKAEKGGSSKPSYKVMVQAAVGHLADGRKGGVSKAKISEYMKKQYHLEEVQNHFVKKALVDLVKDKTLDQLTGKGAAGSFKLSKEKKVELKKAEKAREKVKEKENEKPTKSTVQSKSSSTKSKPPSGTRKPASGKASAKATESAAKKITKKSASTSSLKGAQKKTLKKAISSTSQIEAKAGPSGKKTATGKKK